MALYVVLGPPAAGKSTWVGQRAQHGDIVVDYDRLACALTAPGADGHDHHRVVRSVAHRARQAVIAEALRHVATVDVYVIHSAPRPEAMEKYGRHHAQVITVDPGRDVVLARCKAQRSAWAVGVAERWYAEQPSTQRDTEASSLAPSRTW